MITINIAPIIYSWGHLAFRWYALIVVAAILTGLWVRMREATRKGLAEADLSDAVLWIILAGLAVALPTLIYLLGRWHSGPAALSTR